MAIFARAPLPLGVHCDSEGFALCDVRSTARGAALHRVVFEAYDGREPVEALTAAVRANRWRNRLCVTSFAAERALLHALHLPAMSPHERRAAARLEAERLTPDRDVALSVDVSALPSGWLLAAAPRAEVRATAARAEAAGLRVRAVDLATLALARAIGAQPGDAIVVADRTRAVVHLVTEGAPFVRLLPSRGRCTELAAPLAEALEFAASRGFGVARRVVVAGALAVEDGFVERLADALGRAVTPAELRAEVSADEHPLDYVRASAPRWLTACGLALWSLRSMASCA